MTLESLTIEAQEEKVRTWSPYQEAIFSAITEGEDNLLVSAVPGSGKTTTALEAVKRDPLERKVMLAFNKSIAEEFSHRLGQHGEGMTTHSLGFQVLKKNMFKGKKRPNKWKNYNIYRTF